MAIFLNREGILKHFDRLFEEAKKEIVMVVPYISLNAEILEKLRGASTRNIEVLIIYREKALNDVQKAILHAFNNVTLLHHPHVHAKCYLNEDSMIICSMNLYDKSMKNNREMGILLDFFAEEVAEKENVKTSWFSDDDPALEMAVQEIKTILTASTVEQKSEFVKENGFLFRSLMTKNDYLQELLNKISKLTDNKRFSLRTDKVGDPFIMCENYWENVDLCFDIDLIAEKNKITILDIRRASINLNFPSGQVLSIKSQFCDDSLEYRYKYYKVYWPYGASIKVYRDGKRFPEVWKTGSDTDHLKGILKGCGKVLQDLKKYKEFQKII